MGKLIIKLIIMYRRFSKSIGYQSLPIFYYPICKFEPTCSEYAIESINKHGAFKGAAKSILRFIKCNPFTK